MVAVTQVSAALDIQHVWCSDDWSSGVADVDGVADGRGVSTVVRGRNRAGHRVASAFAEDRIRIGPLNFNRRADVVVNGGPVLVERRRPNAVLTFRPVAKCAISDDEWVQRRGVVFVAIHKGFGSQYHRCFFVNDIEDLIKCAHVATTVDGRVGAGHAARVAAGAALQVLCERQAHHTRTIFRRGQHFVQVVARQGLFNVGSDGWTFRVGDGDGLRANCSVEPVVGHPLTFHHHDEGAVVDLVVDLRECHRSASVLRLVAAFVHGIPVGTVVCGFQTRNGEHGINGIEAAALKGGQFNGDVLRTRDKLRSLCVIHRERLGHRLGSVVLEIEYTVGDLIEFVTTESVEEHFVADVGNDVTRESCHGFAVVDTLPTEPTAEAVVAVVVVSSSTKLESLVERHRHVAQEERFASEAVVQTSQARQGVHHVEHINL